MSATRYRLPDGVEVASLDVNGSTDNRAWLTHPTLGQILIDRDKLTEVAPPLPPEPPNGTVYSNGADAVIRAGDIDGKGRWYTTDCPDYQCWEDIAALVAGPGWRRYIPDPADNAPALPWECDDAEDDGDQLTIEPARRTDLAAFVKTSRDGVRLTAADARQAAAALLRAAREVEQP